MAGAMALYRTSVNRALGDGTWEAFKGLDVTNSDFLELQKTRTALGGLRKGQSFTDEITGNRYRIVRARGTITGEGYILKQYIGAAGRVGNLTGASTKAVQVTDDTFVAHDLVDGYEFINAGTAVGELRTILENDDTAGASTITVAAKRRVYPGETVADSPDNFVALPDATSDYVAFCPWEVVQTSAVTDYVVACALGAVTDGNWTIVLEQGYGLIRVVGSTDALTAGGPIVPSATAGIGKGFTTAGETAAEARLAFGQSIVAYSGASAVWFGRIFGRFAIGDN